MKAEQGGMSLRARVFASVCGMMVALCMTSPVSADDAADFTGDGLIDSADLAYLLGAWGEAPESRADLDQDGYVGQFDLAILLSSFGLVGDFQIGPIAGLTTGWHRSPNQTGIPLGATVDLRARASRDALVLWHGAQEIMRTDVMSVARCTMTMPGTQSVMADVVSDGVIERFDIQLDVIDIEVDDIVVSAIEMLYEPLEIDETLPPDEINELTMYYYYAENSIASITEVDADSYLTSVGRDLPMQVLVTPTAFAPLLEWRSDGYTEWDIGIWGLSRFDDVGLHSVAVGPPAVEARIDVETYAVTITSHISNQDIVPEGEPVLFEAVTDPPGYEDEITWLSSTLYGTGSPVLGYGPTFAVQFDDTWGYESGEPFQWLGVKSDNTVFNQDLKPLFKDEFEDGEIPQRYSVFGNASMVEEDGLLKIFIPDNESGLKIDTSDLPEMVCFQMQYAIDPAGFEIGTALRFSWTAPSITIPDFEFEALSLTLTRPFWNKCTYEVKQKDNDAVVIGFTGKFGTEDNPCPDADNIRLDWLPKFVDDEGVERQRFMIEIKGGETLKNPIRVEGKDYEKGAGDTPPFSHDDNMIKDIKITKVGAGDEATERNQTLLIEIDVLCIDDSHIGLEGSGGEFLSALEIDPDVYERGDVLTISFTTLFPFMIPDVTTLNMGPDVFISSFTVLDAMEAVAEITVDDRALNAGHWAILDTDGFLLSSDFNVKPLDPNSPLPPNEPPDASINAPFEVEAGTPFDIDVTFNDLDDEFIQGLVVIMEITSTAEVFDSGDFFVDTSGDTPVVVVFNVPGLPAGDYKILAIPHDGLSPESPVEAPLTVSDP